MSPKDVIKEVSILLSDIVIFPYTVHRIVVPDDIEFNNNKVVVFFEKQQHILSTGILCDVIDEHQRSDGRVALLEGIQRVNIQDRKRQFVFYSKCNIKVNENSDLLNLSKSVYGLFEKNFSLVDPELISLDTILSVIQPDHPDELADFISSYLPLKYDEKLNIIEAIDVYHRLELVKKYLNQLIIDRQFDSEIDGVIQQSVNFERKQMILKAKLRAIQEELNSSFQSDFVEEYREKLNTIKLNKDYKAQILFDIQKLEQYPDDSTEFALTKAYLDTLFSVPWIKKVHPKIDIQRVQGELAENHYGLDSVKTRILEHLAIRKVAGKQVGTVLCLAGPPGVGKTSIVQSIAHALRRPFIRLSLGGVKDEAELRGHRRAYVGAMPGKIVTSLIKAQSINPVFCLDEIDKLAGGFKGDPSAALLEILDIEQNKTFVDHYIQYPVDLSKCMFVCTANDLNNIPEPLLNRLEVILIPGYTIIEKVTVARDYLFPKACSELNLPLSDISIDEGLWSYIINQYISDVGLRELRQVIEKITRKIALTYVKKQKIQKKWSKKVIHDMLGEGQPKPSFSIEPCVGRSVGLMLKSMVGYCCPIETQVYKGKPGFTATGNIDPKLEESIRIVFGLLKTRYKEYSIDEDILFNSHFHIHFQNTNLYKSGNGWDLGIFASILSKLMGIALPGTMTFSGQLSLSGIILPVGGVSNKLLAGSHIGIHKLIVSSMEVLPRADQYSTELIPMNNIDELIKSVLKKL